MDWKGNGMEHTNEIFANPRLLKKTIKGKEGCSMIELWLGH